MLKLTYTDTGMHMEQVDLPLEVPIAQRVILAIRSGQMLYVEPGWASFLLPSDTPGLIQFKSLLQAELHSQITIAPVDDRFLEVSLAGSWIAQSAEAHEGVFMTAMSDRVESSIFKLWQAAQYQASYLV
jgi:hypothetical protein